MIRTMRLRTCCEFCMNKVLFASAVVGSLTGWLRNCVALPSSARKALVNSHRLVADQRTSGSGTSETFFDVCNCQSNIFKKGLQLLKALNCASSLLLSSFKTRILSSNSTFYIYALSFIV